MRTNTNRVAAGSTLRELVEADRPAPNAANESKRRVGRFEIYVSLKAIYGIFLDWKRRKVANRSARALARELSIVQRKGMSPIRILIEATLPAADFKQKSRWVRALEYVASERVPKAKFRRFVRASGGIAGCARLAVGVERKRRRPLRDFPMGDWSD